MNLYTRLINKDHPLPPDYVPENLTDIGIPFDAPCGDPKRLLEIRTAHAALMLIQAAQRESLILTGISGYRSYKRQQQLCIGHSNPASSTPYQQISPAPVNPYVALPGTSEHQSGLALDVSCPAVNHELITEFAETPEGKWLVKNASLYGFIIRYPANKESVTGIPWEPWHIRYVTRPLASCLALTGLTLEEYYTTFGAPLQNPEFKVP